MNDNLIDIKNLAKQKFNLSLYKDVIDIINNFLNDFKNCSDSEIYYIRGLANQELKLYENAIEDYDKAIKLNSNDEKMYYLRALSKLQLGLFEESIRDYNKFIEFNPNYVWAYNDRGNAKYNLGLYYDAIEDYNK